MPPFLFIDSPSRKPYNEPQTKVAILSNPKAPFILKKGFSFPKNLAIIEQSLVLSNFLCKGRVYETQTETSDRFFIQN